MIQLFFQAAYLSVNGYGVDNQSTQYQQHHSHDHIYLTFLPEGIGHLNGG